MTKCVGPLLALAIASRAMATPVVPVSGHWAGDRMRLEATAAGARLALDCADGSIDGPIIPDRIGHFAATGVLKAYRPGPQLADEPDTGDIAQFSGTIHYDRMTLIVKRHGAVPKTYHLVRDGAIKAVRCL